MYYTVYKITNKVNGKIYIGCHKTNDLNDGYMGSGKYLLYSQEKHGIENFTKEILFVYDNPEQMFDKEAEIVNEDFISEQNTYNLKVGGFGGWDYVNSNNLNTRELSSEQAKSMASISGDIHKQKMKDEEYSDEWKKRVSESMKKYYRENGSHWKGKKHTEETKKRIGAKTSKAQTGNKNSQYGTRWIHSLSEKRSIRIKKEDPLPEGWSEGRKIKFN